MNAFSPARPRRPSDKRIDASVKAAIATARDVGLDVAGFEVAPDGTIRILSSAAFPAAPRDEFEQWDQSGKL